MMECPDVKRQERREVFQTRGEVYLDGTTTRTRAKIKKNKCNYGLKVKENARECGLRQKNNATSKVIGCHPRPRA